MKLLLTFLLCFVLIIHCKTSEHKYLIPKAQTMFPWSTNQFNFSSNGANSSFLQLLKVNTPTYSGTFPTVRCSVTVPMRQKCHASCLYRRKNSVNIPPHQSCYSWPSENILTPGPRPSANRFPAAHEQSASICY